MKRSIWFILILFLSSYIMQSALPEKGLLGLINGVDVKNHITLLSSDFFFAALIVFSNFGQTEGFLFGIGKYQLMRYKNRNSLLRKIILKSFIIVGIMCLLRIIIYMLVLMLRNKYVFDLQISDIMIWLKINNESSGYPNSDKANVPIQNRWLITIIFRPRSAVSSPSTVSVSADTSSL